MSPLVPSPSNIGVEFASKKLDIDENYKLKLQIWDTAGQ